MTSDSTDPTPKPEASLAKADPVHPEVSLIGEAERREFQGWVETFYADVFRYAFRLVGDAAGAEDVVQQTFLQAWVHRQQLSAVESHRAWLLTIARNTFLKSMRKQRPETFSKLGVDADSVLAVSYATETFDVKEWLAKLPEENRVVVLMFYFEGLAYRDIAEQLNLPIGTVMSRLHRAKQQLRDWDRDRE